MKTAEMDLTALLSDETAVKSAEPLGNYLGFEIHADGGNYVGTPRGWSGEELRHESVPKLRTRIWRWWHQVN